MILKLLKNPAIGYVSSRYITYGIQFLNSILIAVYLGPVSLGIWGFINLVIQYFSQFNFGVSHSVNTIASIKKHQEKYVSWLVGNSIFILGFLSIIVGGLFLLNDLLSWNIGAKYEFYQFETEVLIVVVTAYFISLFSNIYRIYGKLFEIAFSQSIFPFCTLLFLLLFREDNLLTNLVNLYVGTSILSLGLFVTRFPIKIKFNFNPRLFQILVKKGWYLFLYNSSFYLIIISTRSFISHFYEVEEFGYFTFAFSLANVILLLLGAFTFLIWPKLLNSLSKANEEKSFQLIQRLRNVYISSTHFLIHTAIFLFPLFLMFFPKYSGTFGVFALISLTIILMTNTFGYVALLISKGREKNVGYLSMGTLLLNIILCYLLATVIKVGYDKVILATMFSYFLYALAIGFMGRQLLKIEFSFVQTFKDIFSLPIIAPFIIALGFIVLDVDKHLFFIPILVYCILNFKNFKSVVLTIKQVIVKPKSFEF